MATNHGQFDSFEYKGMWWVPDRLDEKIAGVLRKNGQELELELFDAEGRISRVIGRFGLYQLPTAPVIFGALEKGKICTLYDVYEKSRNMSQSAVEVSKLLPMVLLFGSHNIRANEELGESASLEFTGMDHWRLWGEVQFSNDLFHEENRKGWRIEQIPPRSISIQIPTLESEVKLWVSSGSKSDLSSTSLTLTPVFTITSVKLRGMDWFLKVIRDIRNWLTLIMGTPVQATRITVYGASEVGSQLIHQSLTKQIARTIDHADIRIFAKHILDDLEYLLPTWFEQRDRLNDVLNLFFGAIYASDMYTEFKFLSLIQAFEAFSRATTDSTYTTEEKYKDIYQSLVRSIPNDTPEALRSSLKNRIKYGNEFSLRKRLDNSLKSLNPETMKLICKDRECYVDQVVATRNYLTHYTSELLKQAWIGEKQYLGYESLKYLLTILLYRQIGLAEERIQQALKEHYISHMSIAKYLQIL